MSTPTRVLYVDDDEGLRTLVRRALERRGFAVSLAASGAEGVAMVQADRFDIIAVDHYMPGQDGLTTLAALTALPDPPPVVYVTGSEESRIAVAALKAGAADYVVKTVGEDFFDLLARAFVSALEQVQLRQEAERAKAALVASNKRLEALLSEVNHRVANSLQLVSAFIRMQAQATPDDGAKQALEDTMSRIDAIVQVHRELYTGNDVEKVDMRAYLSALVVGLERTWSTPETPMTLRLDCEEVSLNTDRAIAVGVVVNELISNACKYAYDAGGEVRVALRVQDRDILLTVEDDGVGMKPGGPTGTGVGAKLIKAMASSLGGQVDYSGAGRGVLARLRIPRDV